MVLNVTYLGDYEKGFEIFIPQRQNGLGKRRNRGYPGEIPYRRML